MEHGPEILRDLALVLCVAAVTTVLFRKLRQPVVVGYLIAGVIVGPYLPIPLFAGEGSVHRLSELGVVLVMFSIGLEFSVKRLMAVIPTAGLIGIIQVSTMLWLGYLAGQALGWGTSQSIFAGAALAIASTMIVVKQFEEQAVPESLRELIVGVLVIEDLAAVLMLAVMAAMAGSGGAENTNLLALLGQLALVLAAMVAAGYLVVPRAIRIVTSLGSRETTLVASVGIAFALALLARQAGFSIELGAFLAGTLIAEAGVGHSIEKLVRPLRDLFAAVFFVAVGMSIDPSGFVTDWPIVLLFLGIVVVGKILSVMLGAILSGFDVRTAVQAGMSLTPLGEFSFIFVSLGVASGAVEASLAPIIVAVAAATAFLAPVLVRASPRIASAVDRRLPHAVQTFVTFYGTWLERLRERRREPRSPARRLVWILVLDGLLLVALIASTSLLIKPLSTWVHDGLGWEAVPAEWIVLGGAVVLALPLVFGLSAASRRLGELLTAQVVPPAAAGRADFGAAPRRALLGSLRLGVLLAVLVPIVALTQPFLPLLSGLPVLLVLAVVAGVSFWRSATNLRDHVNAGSEVLLGALRSAGSAGSPRPEAAETPSDHAVPAIETLLPGLGSVVEHRVQSGSPCDGSTLRQLNLRGRTGATIVAIRRGGEHIGSPGGATRLLSGDVLAVAGTQQAIEDAEHVLDDKPRDDAPRDDEP
ncbi:MAG: cation:proton antiporter domain-containing protein [Planctomycetota bacterium]